MSFTQVSNYSTNLGSALAAIADHNIEVRLARNEREVIAAQKLRYRVFYEEMKAVACADTHSAGMDHDRFDDVADHLLVIDKSQIGIDAQVVGTYRLLRKSHVETLGGFYTQGEYDISALKKSGGNLLELGRSCIDADYRKGRVMDMLWRGLAAYLTYYDIDVMFGCASLSGTNPDALIVPLSYLYHNHLAPTKICPIANLGQYVHMNRLKAAEINIKRAFVSLPPIIKGYLRVGSMVGDGAVVDYQFNTVDVCMVMNVKEISNRYQARFIKQA